MADTTWGEGNVQKVRSGSRVVFVGALVGTFSLAPAATGGAGNPGATPGPTSPSPAAEVVPPLYVVDPDHSSLEFTVRHLGLTKVRGIFHGWSAALSYDPEDVLHSSVTVIVEIASLDTDNADRDQDLMSPHFFDAERFPMAVFQSTEVRRTGDGFVARGELKIRDVVRDVEIPFVHTGSFESPSGRSAREGFEGSLDIARADFGVVYEGNILETTGAIGKDVRLEIELSAMRLNWAAFPFRHVQDRRSLGEELLATADSVGADATVVRYHELSASGRAPPTSFRDMAVLAARLGAVGRGALAGTLMKLYAGSHATDARAQLLAADVLVAAGGRDDALDYYRGAADLSPELAEAPERIRVLTGHSHDATLLQRGETSR